MTEWSINDDTGGLTQQALGAGFGGHPLGALTGLTQQLGAGMAGTNITWNADHLTVLTPTVPHPAKSEEERWLRGRVKEICQYGVHEKSIGD